MSELPQEARLARLTTGSLPSLGSCGLPFQSVPLMTQAVRRTQDCCPERVASATWTLAHILRGSATKFSIIMALSEAPKIIYITYILQGSMSIRLQQRPKPLCQHMPNVWLYVFFLVRKWARRPHYEVLISIGNLSSLGQGLRIPYAKHAIQLQI